MKMIIAKALLRIILAVTGLAAIGIWAGRPMLFSQTGAFSSPAYYVSGTGDDSWSGLLPSPNLAKTDGPFLTLARAQRAMSTSSTRKTTFIRAGTFFPPATSGSGCDFGGLASINLVAADSGETWSYYPPDGYNTAILDGGAAFVAQSGPAGRVTGAPPSLGLLDCAFGSYNGATNVTINGLQFQNWRYGPLVLNGTGTTANFTFTNNVVHDTRLVPLGGAVQLDCGNGSVISNNYIYNVPYHAIALGACDGGPTSTPVRNVTISGNFILNSCTWAPDNSGGGSGGDCGGIYVNILGTSSSDIQFTNNYIRDINTSSNGAGSFGACCAMGIYLDAAYNVTMSGNVIGGVKSGCFLTHGGGNHFVGNICDIGSPLQIIALDVYRDTNNVSGPGNTAQHNIIVTNQSGGGNGYNASSCTPGFDAGCGTAYPMAISNNAYFNYAGSSVKSTGIALQLGDSNPAYLNPSLSCWAVNVAAKSPASKPPVKFPGITGGWGPPGFVVPETGSAPSWPHGC